MEKINIGVYWTLKRGESNHYLIEKAKLVWNTYVNCYWITWMWFPKADFIFNWKTPIQLEIEVYEVTDENMLKNLDRLEWHPNWYERMFIDTPIWPVQIYQMKTERVNYLPTKEDNNVHYLVSQWDNKYSWSTILYNKMKQDVKNIWLSR